MNPEFPFIPSVPEPVQPDTAADTAPPEPTPPPEPEPEAAPEPAPVEESEPDGGEYRFIYGYPTTYPELGLTFEPGDLHDWPDGPPTDGRWTPANPKE